MRYNSITTIGSLTVNSGTDYLWLIPSLCAGLDGGAGRVNVEDFAGADGGFQFPPLLGPVIATLGGLLVITSSGTEAGVRTATDTLDAAIAAVVDGSRAAAITVTWAAGSASMWFYQAYESHWDPSLGGMVCTFGLTDAVVAS